MKRRQPQFDSPRDTEKEIARYMLKDALIHALIIAVVIVGLYFSVKYGETVDIICNKFLK
jgi:hypothetical protein